MDEPQRESWWVGFARFQWFFILAVVGGIAEAFLPKLFADSFPRLAFFLSVAVWLFLAGLVVFFILRGLFKVFRPDNPADLSLR